MDLFYKVCIYGNSATEGNRLTRRDSRLRIMGLAKTAGCHFLALGTKIEEFFEISRRRKRERERQREREREREREGGGELNVGAL